MPLTIIQRMALTQTVAHNTCSLPRSSTEMASKPPRNRDTKAGSSPRATAPPVSVVIPALNAQATLLATLESVFAQDYRGDTEVIVADGSPEPAGTAELVRRRFPDVTLVRNPDQTTPSALNRAIQAAKHEIIVRCDAHAVLPPHYISRAVATMARTGAANVGGRQNPVGASAFGRAVALATSTPLGVGDARYRLDGAEGPADTVYLGTFRRDPLEALGGFDNAFLRNQDYELNWRLREAGETVWFDPGLVVDYRPRDTLGALVRQYFDYGVWKRAMLAKHPRSWRLRQLAAPALVLGFACSALLGIVGGLLAAEAIGPAVRPVLLALATVCPVGYVLLVLAGSFVVGVRRRCRAAVLMPLALVTMHMAWGIGFLVSRRIRRTIEGASSAD